MDKRVWEHCGIIMSGTYSAIAGEARDVVDGKLLHELVAVLLHGFDAEAERLRDLFDGLAFGNQPENIPLLRTQAGGLDLGQDFLLR